MSADRPSVTNSRWPAILATVMLLGAVALIVRLVVTSQPQLPVEKAVQNSGDEHTEATDSLTSDGTDDAGGAATDEAEGLHGFVLSPASEAPDIAVSDAAGNAWSLSDHRGKVVALFFGYTSCPDVCPQTLALLASAKAALEYGSDAFEVAMITVDPERDTSEVLAQYMAGFDKSFMGLEAGDNLQAIAAEYGSTYTRDLPPEIATQAAAIAAHDEAGDSEHDDGAEVAPQGHSAELPGNFERGSPAYTVAHSGVVFLIDPQGLLRSSYLAPFDPVELAADVTLLLDDDRRNAKAR